MPDSIFQKESTCCFTGHRSIPAEYISKVKRQLCNAIEQLFKCGITTFISGGAVGFDILAAKAVLYIKKSHPEISLVMILPCRDQHAKWGAREKTEYENVLKVADEIYCLNDKYCTGCMHQRNRVMVDASSHCIAYCTKTSGGTAYTLDLARDAGLEVLNVADLL